ncbi:MAG TPA: twin-arginine translocase TatA/TatE family subunit [Candidatus Limnocylindria bacterium]|nr:twin-arginine translocase TatA/TatE family subunit [Candidatus Limnocylindria bacterium]
MFGIGPEELLLIALVALLVLGPERMPKLMRDIGKVVGDLRRTSDELRDDFLNADKYLEAKPTSVATTTPEAPAAEGAPSGPPGESAFDREMREAKERLRGT